MELSGQSSDTYTTLFAIWFFGDFQVFFWCHEGFLIGEECKDRGAGRNYVPDGWRGALSSTMFEEIAEKRDSGERGNSLAWSAKIYFNGKTDRYLTGIYNVLSVFR